MIVQHKQLLGNPVASAMHNRQLQPHLAAQQHEQQHQQYYPAECQYGGQQASNEQQMYPLPQQHQQLASHQLPPNQTMQAARFNQQQQYQQQQQEHLRQQAQPPVPQPTPISQQAYHHAPYEQQLIGAQLQHQQQPVGHLNLEPMMQRVPQMHQHQRQPVVANHAHHQHQRASPYSMAAGPQPVRAGRLPQPPQQQYCAKPTRPMLDQCTINHHQPPHPNQPAPLRQAANYQLNGYEEFPSGSPTLLQQQLNRQPRAAPQMSPNGRFIPSVAKRRLEDSMEQNYEQPPHQVAVQNGAPRLQFYPQQQQQQQQQQHHHHHHQVKLNGAQMGRAQAGARHLEQPHLLGNPTPPLTPTNARCAQPPSQQQSLTQQQPVVDSQWHHHNGDHVQHSSSSISSFAVSPTMHNKQPMNQQLHHSNEGNITSAGGMLSAGARVPMPKNHSNNSFQQFHQGAQTSHLAPMQHQNQPNLHQNHHPEMGSPTQMVAQVPVTRHPNELQVINQTRLTLPLNEAPVLGPFRLDHETQLTSKVFHLRAHLFETLSKSMGLVNPQTATAIQELQFRAYVVKPATSGPQGNSLLASNHHNQHQHQQSAQQTSRQCNWPEHFQASINQNPLHLDRPKAQPHRAADVFQFCQMGDNVLEIQVKDCYCTHEFVIEAVDRPTMKAFMNSCFKSRMLSIEGCLQKFKFNFGSPGFLIQSQQLQQAAGIFNEYVNEFIPGMEQTRTRISIRCPITYRRMRTPTRGHNCKHLQCFDLESFLFMNRERSQWFCPICSMAIPFNMLELDQHQINVVQAMSEILNTDDVLFDGNGQWQAYYGPPPPPPSGAVPAQPVQQHQPTTAKSTGTYHPQAQVMNGNGSPNQQPMRPISGPTVVNSSRQVIPPNNSNSPANWDNQHHDRLNTSPITSSQPVRRPASALNQTGGTRSANGSPSIKKQCMNTVQYQQNQNNAPLLPPQPSGTNPNGVYFANNATHSGQPVAQQAFSSVADTADELSPLAAMERTIIQHEQQMGPPPFDPNSLTSSPMRTVGPANPNATTATPSAQLTSSLISPSQPNNGVTMVQKSPESANRVGNQTTTFSPASHGVSSPASRMVPASPSQQQQQSPMHQQLNQHQQQNISTPNTPSMLIHNGPETPATPSNSLGCNGNNQLMSSHGSIHMGNSMSQGVDHQPLSNGSASAASITSSSTLTPSGQSLGSVGMGGDSRCGTAPLQGNGPLGLDDLMVPGSMQAYGSNSTISMSQYGKQSSLHNSNSSMNLNDKSEILMNKLMMDSSESLLRDHHHNGDLAIALEEAEWKQQLDRGKSEHLANFLNEPLMKKHQQQYQQHNMNTTLAGSPIPSEDENLSPSQNVDPLQFANYLNGEAVDSGAGLPPDDSILDLFER